MNQPELGQKIVALRKQKGLTQEELVEACGLNVRTLQRIETGEVNPRSHTVRLIFQALDYAPEVMPQKEQPGIPTGWKAKVLKFYDYLTSPEVMNNMNRFFYNFFIASGVIYLIGFFYIMANEIKVYTQGIVLSLIFPLAYALLRLFDHRIEAKTENSNSQNEASKSKSR